MNEYLYCHLHVVLDFICSMEMTLNKLYPAFNVTKHLYRFLCSARFHLAV